jgi:hypothetical protein
MNCGRQFARDVFWLVILVTVISSIALSGFTRPVSAAPYQMMDLRDVALPTTSPSPSPTSPAAPIAEAPCSGDLSAFVAKSDPSTGPPKNNGLIPLSRAELQTIILTRLAACSAQISKALSMQRYLVHLQQPSLDSAVCDPVQVERRTQLTSWPLYSWMDRLTLCSNYVAALMAVQIPTPILNTDLPVLYILSASGGVPVRITPAGGKGGGGGGGGAAGAPATPGAGSVGSPAGGGGAAGASGAATSSSAIDSTAALLLYTIAVSLHDNLSKTPLPPNTLIVPASLWTIEDFIAQCELNPLKHNDDGSYQGTYGALLLDGSTTNSPNQFGLVVSAGWSRARYSVMLATCGEQTPIPTIRWSQKVEGWDRRVGVPLLPFAAYLAYWAPAQALRGAATTSSTSTTITTGNISTTQSTSSTGTNNTILAAASAAGLGNFLQGISGFTIGDTSAGMTTPRAFADLSKTLSNRFGWTYCDGFLPNLKTVGCIRRAADVVLGEVAQIYHACRCSTLPVSLSSLALPDGFDDATGMPQLRLADTPRVCAEPYPNEPGYLRFVVAPLSQREGCAGTTSGAIPFEGVVYKDPNGEPIISGCPIGKASEASPNPGDALAAEYLIHSSPASVCDIFALTNAHRLFCLIETAREDLSATGTGCGQARIDQSAINSPSIWPSPTPPASIPELSARSRSALTEPGTGARTAPVHISWCAVRTIARQDGTWRADITAQVKATLFNKIPINHITAVKVQVTPLDGFGSPVDGDDPQQVTFTLSWGSLGWKHREWVRLDRNEAQSDSHLPQVWLTAPPFVKCDPLAVEYLREPPWKPKSAPLPKPKPQQ